MQAYYGSRFSPNMTRTTDGFLICHNVPLARTGEQDYLGSEVGMSDSSIVKVYRKPEEVFKKATLASFEGKPVTDDHPAEFVEPGNATGYIRGTCTNVRRGTGKNADLIIGDLIIYDATLISEIESGKREISAGYLCDYRECDGGMEQCNIICNHIAVVHNGRAGSRVAIMDEKPVIKNGGKTMSKKGNIVSRMLAVFAKDEDTTPEDLKEAMDAVNEPEEKPETKPEVKPEVKDEDVLEEAVKKALDTALAPFMKRIADLEARVKDSEPDDLDNLEKELSKDEDLVDNEESVTKAPEDIKTEDADKEDDETEKPTVDRAVARSILRAIKPTIANLPADQRQLAVDSLRDVLILQKKNNDVYAKMLHAKAADHGMAHASDFGEACRKMNPHYRKEGK